MNQTSPGWTWVTHTGVAMAENGAGWDAWKTGKFPLSDGQGIGLSQALRQNVHFIRGKVPGRTRTGQVLWGWGKTNKSPSQGTIQVHLNQETQYSKTTEGSSEKRACYIIPLLRFVCVCCIVCESQQKDGVSGWQRNKAQTAVFKAVIPSRRMQTLQKDPEKLRNLCILNNLCSWAGIAQLDLHHYSADQDPRHCSLTRPQATTQLSEPGELT